MRDNRSTATREIIICSRTAAANMAEGKDDELCVEEHLLIFVDGNLLGRTIHTPGNDLDLVLGFVYVECGVSGEDIAGLEMSRVSAGMQRADVTLTPVAASRMGADGGFDPFEALKVSSKAGPRRSWSLTPREISALMKRMESEQVIFPRTGGAHCSALFTTNGERLAQVEDIGRHNALDKAIGVCLRKGRIQDAAIGVMSSRLSWELVRKASAAGLDMLTGISVATSLAVETAEQCRLTLVGRVRRGTMNVYGHPYRVDMTGTSHIAQPRPRLIAAYS